jgi:hypothetical protein
MLIAVLSFLTWLAPLLNAAPSFLHLAANLLNAVLLFLIWLAQSSIAAPPLLNLLALLVIALPPWFE